MLLPKWSLKWLTLQVALTAARGRGKSAAVGLAVAGSLALGYSNVFVTAPSPENLSTLFQFILQVRLVCRLIATTCRVAPCGPVCCAWVRAAARWHCVTWYAQAWRWALRMGGFWLLGLARPLGNTTCMPALWHSSKRALPVPVLMVW